MNKLNKFITLVLLAAGIALAPSALAATVTNVKYIDAAGQEQTCAEATVVAASESRMTWNAGWYVVTSEVTVRGGADCSGAVHLILADTGKLTISGVADKNAGIAVTNANSLAIYGQAAGTGALTVTGGYHGAGIGGGYQGAGSDITINSGKVTAMGGYNATGIGGGYQGDGSNITINGGSVVAMGDYNAAGIGGSGGLDRSCTSIKINGGVVMATGGRNGCSGIGCGSGSASGASGIYAADAVAVKAGNVPLKVDNVSTIAPIDHTGTQDIASSLKEKQYAIVALVTCTREEVTGTRVLEAGKTYTAVPAQVTQDGGAFNVKSGATLTGSNVCFAGNTVQKEESANEGRKGGAIFVTNGVVRLSDATFIGNTAVGQGGAICVAAGATLTCTNVTFEGCLSANYGGAVSLYGLVTLKDAVFRNNRASSGAAVRVQSTGVLSLDGVTFEGNEAVYDGAVNNRGKVNIAGRVELKAALDYWCNKGSTKVNWDLTGGLEHYGTLVNFQLFTNMNATVKQLISITDDQPAGDYVIATGDFSNIKKANTENFSITNVTSGAVKQTTINGDTVYSADGWTGYKLVTVEDLDAVPPTTNLVLKITKYTCKRAVVKAGASTNLVEDVYTAAPTTKNGGAFYLNIDATLTCTNGEFAANEANYGGAIYNYSGNVALKGAVFKDNKASSGGAIMNFGTLSLDGVTFEGNTANFGGAINNSNGFTLNLDGAVTLKTATDTLHNSGTLNWNLTGGKQGVLNGYDKLTTESAGKLWLLVEDYATATNFVIATGEFSNTTGKDTFIIKPYLPVKIDGDTVISTDGWYGYQLVTEEDPSVPTTNLVLYVTKYTCVREQVWYGATKALEKGKTYTAAPTTEHGGAFFVYPTGTLTGSDATFVDNEAPFGGAIYNGANSTLSLDGVTFKGNKAEHGGAIYNYGTLSLDGVIFDDNEASVFGGAIENAGNRTLNLDGPVTLVTTNDTIYNQGTLNWNLAGGKQGFLDGYQNITCAGSKPNLQLTVGDYVTETTNFVIATGDFSDVKGKDTFSMTNVTSGASPCTATIKIGGVTLLNGTWWSLKVEEPKKLKMALKAAAVETSRLVLATVPAEDLVQLTDVEIVDKKGVTNATAVVKVAGAVAQQNKDGSYTVPKGYEITLEYQTTDDYMFGPGWTTKTVVLEPLTGDYAMTDDDKPSTQKRWVDEREIAIDTRERIVVGSPNEVLPIAYSTNNWGEVTADQTTVYYFRDGEYVQTVVENTNENGYVEWQPTYEEYGKYTFWQSWYSSGQYLAMTNATIYYSGYYPLTLVDPTNGTYTAKVSGQTLASGDEVLGYEYVNLKATPTYDNANRYEFTGWAATTGGVNYAEGFTNTATAVTRFEMPLCAAAIAAGFQWKSNYTETVEVGSGIYDAWEIHEGETYPQGITTKAGSIVSLRGTVQPGQVTINAGATNVWDFTDNGRPCFKDFNTIANNGGTLLVLFDDTLTNDTYKIATEADDAVGMTFTIANDTDAKGCTVVKESDCGTADWTYVGAKRFKLYADGEGRLKLLVEWGAFDVVLHYGLGTVVTNRFPVDQGLALPTDWPTSPKPESMEDAWSGQRVKMIAGWMATNEYYDAAGDLVAWTNEEGKIDYYQSLATSIPPMTLGDQEFWARWSYVDMWYAGATNATGEITDMVMAELVEWTGEMTLSGTFKMQDCVDPKWEDPLTAPWYEGFRPYINLLKVDTNVVYIGAYAFYDCHYLREVFFEAAPEGGTNVFVGCSAAVGYYNRAFEDVWTNRLVNGKWKGLTMYCREDVPTFAEAGCYVMMDVEGRAVLTVADGITEVTCTKNDKGYVIVAPVGVTVKDAPSKPIGRTEVVVKDLKVANDIVTLFLTGAEAPKVYGKKSLSNAKWDEMAIKTVTTEGEDTAVTIESGDYRFFTLEPPK